MKFLTTSGVSKLSLVFSLCTLLQLILPDIEVVASNPDANSGDNVSPFSVSMPMQIPTVLPTLSRLSLMNTPIPVNPSNADESRTSFLSRVFPVTRVPSSTPTLMSTPASIPTPGMTSSAEQQEQSEEQEQHKETQHGATSAAMWLFLGGLGISWGIILFLATRLIILVRHQSPTKVKSETMTSVDYQKLGDMAIGQGKSQLAEQCYRKVAALEPYNKAIHYEIGKFLFQTERYAESIKEFHIALGSEIIPPEIYSYLACAYLAIDQSDKAEKYYHRALEFIQDSSPCSSRHVVPLLQRLNFKQPQKISS